jgi:4-hydroxybenzoate polyprenyltransferase
MYDTIYAHQVCPWSVVIACCLATPALYNRRLTTQDKHDDIKVGVKSTALRFPTSSRILISSLSTTFVSLLTLTGHLAGLGPAYYLISCGGAAAHLAWQCVTVDFESRADCWSKFVSNGWLGLVVWAGLAVEYVAEVVVPGFTA